MDNEQETKKIYIIESKIKQITKEIKNTTVKNKSSIKKNLLELHKENNQMKQRVISCTAALMHQRRKAAQNVDDQYFEHEAFIEAHEELEKEIKKQLEILEAK